MTATGRQLFTSGGIGKKLWPALRNILLVKNAEKIAGLKEE